MKLLTTLALIGITSAATGQDCSSTSWVCDRNSECCGTATANTAVTVANGNTAG